MAVVEPEDNSSQRRGRQTAPQPFATLKGRERDNGVKHRHYQFFRSFAQNYTS